MSGSLGQLTWTALVLFVGFGCARPIPRDALVVTQTPRMIPPGAARDEMDIRYPQGSRLIIVNASSSPESIRVLSQGFSAAGEPVLSADGRRLVFAGKISTKAEWQIYQADTEDGRARPLTAIPGGAKDPALLPDGSLVFVSPVARLGTNAPAAPASALYVLSRGGKPRRLTFGGAGVAEPTVLSDGRVLLVLTRPADAHSPGVSALYTINNDGTEISAFAGQHDRADRLLHRPRELEDGRVAFIVQASKSAPLFTAETVRSARPFHSWAALLAGLKAQVSAVQPARNGGLLVCAQRDADAGNPCSSYALFRVEPGLGSLGSPVLSDGQWDSLEALEVSVSRRPMGRISNVDPSHHTGQILCLDVNDTSESAGNRSQAPRAKRIRVFTLSPSAAQSVLGEVEVQPDGSFMAEVPSDLPLGFEALDETGRVLRREPALIWVRPGENRSCIGCHEPHNHSPKNIRPLAVRVPAPRLVGELAQSVH